ncbi:MAG: BlaI/MecI/CopY family transcriptional regulator [Parahaliea sp.]
MAEHSRVLKNWFGARRSRAKTPVLGERELAVLDVLWQEGEQTAQQILQHMQNWNISLSTVQSTLERLHRKGLLVRTKAVRAYHYQAHISRSEIISSLLHDMTQEIAGGDMAPVVSGFIDYLGSEPTVASELSRLIDKAADRDG